jgi:hypothetical protein
MRELRPFNGRTGAVGLMPAGVGVGEASAASPTQTGTPHAPTAAPAVTIITHIGVL